MPHVVRLAVMLSLLAIPRTLPALDVFLGVTATNVLSKDDISVHRMKDEFYAESWFFMARAGDGTQIFIHYGVTNAGFGSFTGAVETTVIRPDGSILFDKDSKIDGDTIKVSSGEFHVDFGGRGEVMAHGPMFHITAHGSTVSFDLAVTPVIAGLKFGDGKVWFDDKKQEFYAFALLTPKARVAGRVTLGGKPMTFEGWGYGDHSWQNYPAHKMADRLFSLRGFADDHSVSYLAFIAPGGKPIPMLVLTQGDKVLLATHKVTMAESDHVADPEIKNYKIPMTLTLQGSAGGPAFTGTVHFKKQLQRQDAVADFSFFERTMIKMFVAKPILWRHNGDYTFDVGGTKISGSGVIESMILRAD